MKSMWDKFCRIYVLMTITFGLLYAAFYFAYPHIVKIFNGSEVHLASQDRCSDNQYMRKVFYDFRQLNIFFSAYPKKKYSEKELLDREKLVNIMKEKFGPDYEQNDPPSFPHILEKENLEKLIESSLRDTLSACLKNFSGEKPIKFFYADNATDADMDIVHDPKNLTISMMVTFGTVYHPVAPKWSLSMHYFLYRPEVDYKNARLLWPSNSASTFISVDPGEENLLRQKLEDSLKRIKPWFPVTKAPRIHLY